MWCRKCGAPIRPSGEYCKPCREAVEEKADQLIRAEEWRYRSKFEHEKRRLRKARKRQAEKAERRSP